MTFPLEFLKDKCCLITGEPFSELAQRQHKKGLPFFFAAIVQNDRYDFYNAYDLTLHFITKNQLIDPKTRGPVERVIYVWGYTKLCELKSDDFGLLHDQLTFAKACYAEDPVEMVVNQLQQKNWDAIVYNTLVSNFPLKKTLKELPKAPEPILWALENALPNFPTDNSQLEQYLEKEPNDLLALCTLAERKKAIPLFERILKIDPKNVYALCALGEFTKALEICPDHYDSLKGLGMRYFKNLDLKSAKPLFEKMHSQTPNDPGILSVLATIASCEGELALAKKYYKRAGQLYLECGHVDAVASFGSILKIDANDIDALLGLGVWFKSAEYYEKVLKQDATNITALKGLAEITGDKKYYKTLGKLLLDAGTDLDGAACAILAVLHIDPNDIEALLCLAKLQLLYKQYEAAYYNFLCVLNSDSKNATALKGLGDILLYGKAGVKYDKQRALGYYKEFLLIEPENIEVLHAWLQHHWIYDESFALECYEKLIKIDPSDVEAHYLRAEIYVESNDFVAARKLYEKILTIDSKHRDALFSLGFFYYAGNGGPKDHIKVKECCTQLLKINPKDADAHRYMGYILFDGEPGITRDLKGAREYLEKSIELNPKDMDVVVAREMIEQIDAELKK